MHIHPSSLQLGRLPTTTRHWLVRVVLPILASACSRGVTVHNAVQPGQWPNTVTVNGEGKVEAAPDVATMTVGVEVRAKKTEAAVAQVNERMRAVTAALKQLGVQARDLQTQNMAVHLERQHQPRPRPVEEPTQGRPAVQGAPQHASRPRFLTRVTQSLEVKVRQVDRAGKVMGAAIGAGANNVWGLRFVRDDPKSLEAEARNKAVHDAKEKAKAYAEQAGAKLGRVLMIQEGGGASGPMPPSPMLRNYAMAEDAASEAPVEKGALSIHQRVRVVFLLRP